MPSPGEFHTTKRSEWPALVAEHYLVACIKPDALPVPMPPPPCGVCSPCTHISRSLPHGGEVFGLCLCACTTLHGGVGLFEIVMILLQPGLGILQESFHLSQPSSLLVQFLSLPLQLEPQQIQAAVLARQPRHRLLLPLGNILQASSFQVELRLQDGQEKEAGSCLQQGQQLLGVDVCDVRAQGMKLLLEHGGFASELGLYCTLCEGR